MTKLKKICSNELKSFNSRDFPRGAWGYHAGWLFLVVEDWQELQTPQVKVVIFDIEGDPQLDTWIEDSDLHYRRSHVDISYR